MDHADAQDRPNAIPAGHPAAGRWLVIGLVVVGAASLAFGYTMVERFRTTALVWSPSAVDVFDGDELLGSYSKASTNFQASEVAPGHTVRLHLPKPLGEQGVRHAYVLRRSLEQGGSTVVYSAPIEGSVGVSDPAGIRAHVNEQEVWLDIESSVLDVGEIGARIIGVASTGEIAATALDAWDDRLPLAEELGGAKATWTRVDLRINPKLDRPNTGN